MEARELRIGNLVKWHSSIIGKIESISETSVIFSKWQYALSIKEFKPIPLTEEWLLRFGFEKRQETKMANFITYGFRENPITKDWIILIKHFKDENKFFYNNGFHVLKHVHQLQNLYYCLCGEELTTQELNQLKK